MGGIGAGDGALTAANPEEADEGGDEPDECREEAEGDGGLELAALVSVKRMDVVPVEHTTTPVSNQLEVGSMLAIVMIKLVLVRVYMYV